MVFEKFGGIINAAELKACTDSTNNLLSLVNSIAVIEVDDGVPVVHSVQDVLAHQWNSVSETTFAIAELGKIWIGVVLTQDSDESTDGFRHWSLDVYTKEPIHKENFQYYYEFNKEKQQWIRQ